MYAIYVFVFLVLLLLRGFFWYGIAANAIVSAMLLLGGW